MHLASRHAEVGNRHLKKLLAGEPVMLGRRLVDFENRQFFQVKDPHRVRVALEEQAILLFAPAQIRLRRLAPDAFVGLGHGAAHRRGQAVAVLLEDVVGGAGLEGFDGGLFADGAGHEDERQERKLLAHQLERLQPVETRQVVVGQHQVPFPLLERLHKIFTAGDVPDLRRQAVRRELVAHQQGVVRLVLQMQDAEGRGHAHGFMVGRSDVRD